MWPHREAPTVRTNLIKMKAETVICLEKLVNQTGFLFSLMSVGVARIR